MVLAAIIVVTCPAQNDQRASNNSHAEFHARNSYVLVLNQQAIARGPDFSQRASALLYGKKKHLRDFVWFSTEAGCYAVADPESIRNLTEFEKAQKELDQRWKRHAGDPGLVPDLQQQQNEHTARRDEFVWTLFDRLRDEGRLTDAKGSCPPR